MDDGHSTGPRLALGGGKPGRLAQAGGGWCILATRRWPRSADGSFDRAIWCPDGAGSGDAILAVPIPKQHGPLREVTPPQRRYCQCPCPGCQTQKLAACLAGDRLAKRAQFPDRDEWSWQNHEAGVAGLLQIAIHMWLPLTGPRLRNTLVAQASEPRKAPACAGVFASPWSTQGLDGVVDSSVRWDFDGDVAAATVAIAASLTAMAFGFWLLASISLTAALC
jgi:hypothetical protein